MKSKFEPKNRIQDLNNLRIQTGIKPFSKEELVSKLKSIEFPHSTVFLMELRRYNIIELDGTFSYRFCTSPVHYTTLQNAYNSFHNRCAEYNKKSKKKKDISHNKIYEAVKLLKENGFQVYMPIDLDYFNSNVK